MKKEDWKFLALVLAAGLFFLFLYFKFWNV